MKFILLVEGATERRAAAEFLKRWLDPKLSTPVGIQVVNFKGYANLIAKMTKKARMQLEGPKQSEVIAVIALLDLYGPDFYPATKTTATERYEWAKQHFEREVNLDRFRMFFAVHEFEAWLFSDPDIFPPPVRHALPSTVAQPERVNFNEPPAKLLHRIYMKQTQRHYKKTTYGTQLFAKLDPANASAKCPILKAMLEEMLKLAKACGH